MSWASDEDFEPVSCFFHGISSRSSSSFTRFIVLQDSIFVRMVCDVSYWMNQILHDLKARAFALNTAIEATRLDRFQGS